MCFSKGCGNDFKSVYFVRKGGMTVLLALAEFFRASPTVISEH
jgi:hypothetical protein